MERIISIIQFEYLKQPAKLKHYSLQSSYNKTIRDTSLPGPANLFNFVIVCIQGDAVEGKLISQFFLP